MAIRRRSEVTVFSMSFIDCICCGFGAMILLLVLSQSSSPNLIEDPEQHKSREAELRQIAEQTAGERIALEKELAAARSTQQAIESAVSKLRVSSDSVLQRTTEAVQDQTVADTLEQQLASAKQSLSEEMKRLYAQQVRLPTRTNAAAGIPVDSEYIIFVIDTSGSMQQFAWRTVVQKMNEALNAYPKVKGMQVMSDEGEYMYSTYARQWIPDTPGLRKTVLERLRGWQPFSNSSPVEGIEAAIRTFAAQDKKVSIYVFGDDFTGSSIDEVVRTVRRINPRDARGRPLVRIHGIGFPTQYGNNGATVGGVRFATLMRILAEENGGTFVGLQTSQ